jgi:hypothetical protein
MCNTNCFSTSTMVTRKCSFIRTLPVLCISVLCHFSLLNCIYVKVITGRYKQVFYPLSPPVVCSVVALKSTNALHRQVCNFRQDCLCVQIVCQSAYRNWLFIQALCMLVVTSLGGGYIVILLIYVGKMSPCFSSSPYHTNCPLSLH